MDNEERGEYLPKATAIAREASEKRAGPETEDRKWFDEELYKAPGMDTFFESL